MERSSREIGSREWPQRNAKSAKDLGAVEQAGAGGGADRETVQKRKQRYGAACTPRIAGSHKLHTSASRRICTREAQILMPHIGTRSFIKYALRL